MSALPDNNNSSSSNNGDGSFDSFFQGWLVRQEHCLHELSSAVRQCQEIRHGDLNDLISRVLSHYEEYYREKSMAASRDVHAVFSAPWFTPLERTFFWIAGFNPTLAFRIARVSCPCLTEDQVQAMDRLTKETKAEERALSDQWARVQESVAWPPLMVEAEKMEKMREEMEGVVARADFLRMKTAERVVEMLSPAQTVRFLAAAVELQLKIRRLGTEKEGSIRENMMEVDDNN